MKDYKKQLELITIELANDINVRSLEVTIKVDSDSIHLTTGSKSFIQIITEDY